MTAVLRRTSAEPLAAMSWSPVAVTVSPSTNVAGRWPLCSGRSSSWGASRRPHGTSTGCACAASPTSWACVNAGIRPGTAIKAATSRLLRGTPSQEGVVWESCLSGMYRLANRPGHLPSSSQSAACATGLKHPGYTQKTAIYRSMRRAVRRDVRKRARVASKKSWGIIWQDVAPKILPLVFMTLPAAPDTPDTRLELLTAWLRTHADRYGLDVASLAPASSDASFRRYFRLAANGPHGPTLIAVDAPPPEKCREFVQVAHLLETAGVHVPRVLEVDLEAGFMLVTDLGTASYLRALTDGASADGHTPRTLMRDALDALIRWQLTSREDVLPPFDEAFLRREMELMPEWFIGRHLNQPVDEKTRSVLDRTFALLVASARAQPQVFMLRDFMPRNLMVAAAPNLVNPGVLDFQDAVYGPI